MAVSKLSAIAASGSNPASNDKLVGVTAANVDVLFTQAQIQASLSKVGVVTITQPGTGSTLTVADGKTLTASNTLTFTGTDGSSVAFGAGGTVLYGNQTITLSGDVTGSGTTAITTTFSKTGYLKTYVATTDPGAANDNTQGYAAGSIGVNTSTGRAFNCRDASTGAAVWEPLATAMHPGYIANNWYTSVTDAAGPITSVALVAGSIYCSPFIVLERMTVHALAGRVNTLDAAGHIEYALYNNNSGASPAINRPGTKIDSTASLATGSTGALSGSLGADHQIEPGLYWRCWQTDSTTVRMIAYATVPENAAFMGTATVANAVTNGAFTTGVSTTGVFGTWPADLSGSTWTEITTAQSPALAVQTVTVP